MTKKLLYTILIALLYSKTPLAKQIPESRKDGFDRPTEWKKTGKEYTLHHIIPYSNLKDFWNTFFSYYTTNKDDPESKSTLRSLLDLFDVNPETIQMILEDEESENIDWEVVQQKILWQKWNMIEGPEPHRRADDPKQKFDTIPQNSTRYTLKEIYFEKALVKFGNTMGKIEKLLRNNGSFSSKKEKRKLFREIKNQIRSLRVLANSRNQNRYLFNPEKWEKRGKKWRRI